MAKAVLFTGMNINNVWARNCKVRYASPSDKGIAQSFNFQYISLALSNQLQKM
jgi:hypothetical protein